MPVHAVPVRPRAVTRGIVMGYGYDYQKKDYGKEYKKEYKEDYGKKEYGEKEEKEYGKNKKRRDCK
jgi:uncharacterized membrane-anchored protein